MNRGFLSIKEHKFQEKVVSIQSQNAGPGVAILCRFNQRSAACSIL